MFYCVIRAPFFNSGAGLYYIVALQGTDLTPQNL
jgi:hypothetical protein